MGWLFSLVRGSGTESGIEYKEEEQGMSKRQFILRAKSERFIDEDMAWLRLAPRQRIYQTTKLWQFYLTLGGRLDPEPDPQSPFYFSEI